MFNYETITDLGEFMESTSGIVPLITGTYDPAHRGHTEVISQTLEEIQQRDIRNPYVFIPHNLNKTKTPVAPLERRQLWLDWTIEAFVGQLLIDTRRKAIICLSGERAYDLPLEHQARLLRIAGSDKTNIPNGRVETLITDRTSELSSTLVRGLIQQTSNHPELRKRLIAPRVHEDIIEQGYYQKNRT